MLVEGRHGTGRRMPTADVDGRRKHLDRTRGRVRFDEATSRAHVLVTPDCIEVVDEGDGNPRRGEAGQGDIDGQLGYPGGHQLL